MKRITLTMVPMVMLAVAGGAVLAQDPVRPARPAQPVTPSVATPPTPAPRALTPAHPIEAPYFHLAPRALMDMDASRVYDMEAQREVQREVRDEMQRAMEKSRIDMADARIESLRAMDEARASMKYDRAF